MLAWLGVPEDWDGLSKRNLNGACVAFDTRNQEVMAVISEWGRCALIKDCIAPPGSSRANHRQDQALLTVLAYRSGLITTTTKNRFGFRIHPAERRQRNMERLGIETQNRLLKAQIDKAMARHEALQSKSEKREAKLNAAIGKRDARIAALMARLDDRSQAVARSERALASAIEDRRRAERRAEQLRNSASWRVTSPLRAVRAGSSARELIVTIPPSRRCAVSAKCAHSAGFCSTSRNDICVCSRSPPKASKRRTTIRGASPNEGSSNSISRGRIISARPTASICCSPPLMFRRSAGGDLTIREAERRRDRAQLGRRAVVLSRDQHRGAMLFDLGGEGGAPRVSVAP